MMEHPHAPDGGRGNCHAHSAPPCCPQPQAAGAAPALEVKDVHTWFETPAGRVHAVNGIDLQLQPGQRLAIIGESGCGKSVLAQTLLRLLPHNARHSGQIRFGGHDIGTLSEREIATLRGKEIGLIPQHLSSLNPLLRIGLHVAEALAPDSSRLAMRHLQPAVIHHLQRVCLPEQAARQFPHELSGGMNRRALIAMGTARNPTLLIADEPTTGLDRLLRARIVALLDELSQGKTLLLITHDIQIAQFCDTLAVMYAGKIIEQGPTRQVLTQPLHPYTRGLLASMPSRGMQPIPGTSPSLIQLPAGCAFHPRCACADAACSRQAPELIQLHGIQVRCCKAGGA